MANFVTEANVSIVVNRISNSFAFLFGFFCLISILLFCYNFPSRYIASGKKKAALFSFFLIFSLVSFSPLVAGKVDRSAGGELHFELGPLSSVYVVILLTLLIASAIRLFRTSRTSQTAVKKQIRLIMFGVLISVILGVLTNVVIPIFAASFETAKFGPFLTVFLVASTSYAIVKHGLFDIKFVVARSLGYGLSILFIGVSYGLIAFNILNRFVLQDVHITLSQEIVYTGLAIGIAFTFQPLKRVFDRFTNRVFYRDAYDSQELLDKLNKVLVSNIELEKLLQNTSEIIGATLKSSYCMLGIKESGGSPRRIIGTAQKNFNDTAIKLVRSLSPKIHTKVIVTDLLEDHADLQSLLRDNDVAVLVRLTDQPNRLAEGSGYIILGPKKSGNPYSTQDKKVLEIIADEMVIAVQNSLRFEEIQNFAETLQGKVDEATRNLRKANEKLKKLDETKDDFISMASHQLRTPLTSVKGYVSMVIEGDAGKINAQQRKLLDQAFVSSQRMVYLIADLLNVSRLRTGKFIIEPKPTNLAEVVEGEITQLIETAKGRDLTLTYDKPKNFPTLMLDETKIRQVIMNFADNAIYYTPAGGHIKVALTDKTDSIEFTVVDDGIGVPKTEQHHLFNKFYRAGNAKKARPDGTGLGLFMAKKVVIAQGGAIIFHTEEGKGSTFGFSFAKKPLSPDHFKKLPDTTQIPSTTLK